MKKPFFFAAIIASSTAFAAPEYQAQCSVTEMSSVVTAVRDLGNFDLQYPIGVSPTAASIKLPGPTYLTCSFDNRMAHLRFICSGTEKNETFILAETYATRQTFRLYGRSTQGLKVSIDCDLTKN